eukprot:scaffold278_cov55-Cylindrotheca_fusiformis.AAC.1
MAKEDVCNQPGEQDFCLWEPSRLMPSIKVNNPQKKEAAGKLMLKAAEDIPRPWFGIDRTSK